MAPELKRRTCKPAGHDACTSAPYAVHAETSRGRLHHEPEAPTRSPWQRDRDRIIHCSAFRKLQYKTQVFVNHEGDFFRTRLTHCIEVAQIARSIARELGLDEDLTEALALAHDLGHPPFGHAGEEALNLAMKPFGGFDHNAQSLRVVTLLESRYAGWDGLNLTWETLEGLAKHNGPLRNPPAYIAEYNERHKLDLHTHASAEAQVAALADDIAYHSHDLDDGLRARLFGPDEIAHLPVVGEALAAARMSSLDVPPPRLRHETIRRVIDVMVTDLIAETRRRLAKLDAARRRRGAPAKQKVVAFSPADGGGEPGDQGFPACTHVSPLAGQPHDHQGARADRRSCSACCTRTPSLLPDDWRARAGEAGTQRAANVVGDYIAGMTDRYAMDEHRRLTDPVGERMTVKHRSAREGMIAGPSPARARRGENACNAQHDIYARCVKRCCGVAHSRADLPDDVAARVEVTPARDPRMATWRPTPRMVAAQGRAPAAGQTRARHRRSSCGGLPSVAAARARQVQASSTCASIRMPCARCCPRSCAPAKRYGDSAIGNGTRVNVEYVSANPTGPMHIGHCRGAVVGDALANLLAKAGYDVTKEYYINDAGAQVTALAWAAYWRYLQAIGTPLTEEDFADEVPGGLQYRGEYLVPVGERLRAEQYGASLALPGRRHRRAGSRGSTSCATSPSTR